MAHLAGCDPHHALNYQDTDRLVAVSVYGAAADYVADPTGLAGW
jgi:hypothetical protein